MHFLSTLPLLPLLCFPQDAAPAPAAAEPIFALWIDGAAELLGSPKDAGLLAAASMLDDRLVDLLDELAGQMPPLPPHAIRLASHVLVARKSLRVYENPDPSADFPFVVQLELVEADAAAAEDLARAVLELLDEAGAPLEGPGELGLRALALPDGSRLHVGPLGHRFVASFGTPVRAPAQPTSANLPAGVRPSTSLHVDFGRALDVVLDAFPFGVPGVTDELDKVLDTYGLRELVMDWATGSDELRGHSTMRLRGYAGTMRRRGLLPQRGLAEADFAIVPADAEWAQVSTIHAGGMLDMMLEMQAEELAELGIEDPLAELEAATGVNLRTDVVDHLGSVFALYSSKSTGGGGLLSTVAVVELANAEGMLASLRRMQSAIDEAGAAMAQGYVRVRHWEHGGRPLFSLSFPGLPIPLEATIGVGARHLAVGLTPQAALGALAQLERGGPSLLANEAFRSQIPADPLGASGVQFINTPVLAGDGYGVMSLLCSAIANAVRSPGSAREPGLVLPPYATFVQGALAMVRVTRIEGDDYVEYARSDRSLLVNASGVLGMLGSGPLAMVVAAGAGGAFMGARAPAHAPPGAMTWQQFPGEPDSIDMDWGADPDDEEPVLKDAVLDERDDEDGG